MTRKTLALGLAAAGLGALMTLQLGGQKPLGTGIQGLEPASAETGSSAQPTAEYLPVTGLAGTSSRVSGETREASARLDGVEPRSSRSGTLTGTGCPVSGRVVLDDQPAEGVLISYQVKGPQRRSGGRMTPKRNRAPAPKLSQLAGAPLCSNPDLVSSSTHLHEPTSRLGTFQLEGLAPATYEFTFEYPTADESERRRMGGAHIARRSVQLVEGVPSRWSDVRLRREAEYLRIRSTPSIHAEVRVRCGEARVSVRVEDKHTKKSQELGSTNAAGEFTFLWEEPAPVRIGLFDKSGQLLGSTEGFVVLSRERESVFDIQVVPGNLHVSIPTGSQPNEGEAAQYSLHRIPENQAHNQVETVFGGSPPRSTPLVKASKGSVEFKSVRPGRYTVIVRLIAEGQDGRWLPVGSPLQASVQVAPNATTRCRL